MNEEIKVGDWVCLKCPARQVYNVPMIVMAIRNDAISAFWFTESREAQQYMFSRELLEIYKEENWG